jgi:hypothetical protein
MKSTNYLTSPMHYTKVTASFITRNKLNKSPKGQLREELYNFKATKLRNLTST